MRTLFALFLALLVTPAFGQGAQVVPSCGSLLSPPFAVGATRNGTVDINGNVCTQGGLGGGGTGPGGAAMINASSGNVAAATATATLPATAGKTTYICGFSITSSGSTGALVVSPTVTNLVSGTATFTYTSAAGVTVANAPLVVPFNPCLPASAANTTIVVSMPSLGAGNTNTTVNAWGYKQ